MYKYSEKTHGVTLQQHDCSSRAALRDSSILDTRRKNAWFPCSGRAYTALLLGGSCGVTVVCTNFICGGGHARQHYDASDVPEARSADFHRGQRDSRASASSEMQPELGRKRRFRDVPLPLTRAQADQRKRQRIMTPTDHPLTYSRFKRIVIANLASSVSKPSYVVKSLMLLIVIIPGKPALADVNLKLDCTNELVDTGGAEPHSLLWDIWSQCQETGCRFFEKSFQARVHDTDCETGHDYTCTVRRCSIAGCRTSAKTRMEVGT